MTVPRALGDSEDIWQEEREGKEGCKGEEVEELWKVNRGDVVGFVAEHHAAIPKDEPGKCGQE